MVIVQSDGHSFTLVEKALTLAWNESRLWVSCEGEMREKRMTVALKSSAMYAVSDLGWKVGNVMGVIDDRKDGLSNGGLGCL